MIKVNSLNFFDKGFFGKTMAEYAKENASRKVLNSSSLKMNSIDDFNKHFDIISNARKMERVPMDDIYEAVPSHISEIF